MHEQSGHQTLVYFSVTPPAQLKDNVRGLYVVRVSLQTNYIPHTVRKARCPRRIPLKYTTTRPLSNPQDLNPVP